jgi:citrate lyase beta subunit
VYTDIADLDGLRRECEDAVDMGFTGKISIHPNQIEVINGAFTPASEAVAQARALVAAFEEHRAGGVYAFRFNGQMVDAPHLAGALKVLARAGGV